MAAEEEGDDDLFGGLSMYMEEEDDPESAAAKEERAMRKARGDWDLDQIRERFMQKQAEIEAQYPIIWRPRVDPKVESLAAPMRHLPVSLKGPQLASSANIISLKVVKSAIGYPLLVYGTIFVRDELDCKRISLFRRGRDNRQRINSMAESLSLTSPSRGLVVFKNLYFEIDLKCKKRGNERELGNWFVKDSSLTSTSNVIRNRFVGKLFTLDLTYAPAHRAVELTVDVKICEVLRRKKRPSGYIAEEWFPYNKKECSEFHGKLTARVNGVPEEIVLYDSRAAGCVTRVGDGGRLLLSWRVLAVPIDDKVSFKIVSPDGARVIDCYPRLRGCSSAEICVGSYKLDFKLIWSALYARNVDGLPRCLSLHYVPVQSKNYV